MAVAHVTGGLVEALNARVYGHGNQTLVLAHGFGSDQMAWHYILPYLAYYFKLLVFDMAFSWKVRPDFYDKEKYSTFNGYADDLIGLLDELNMTRSIYLGHSMSAMVGCIAATQRPQLFEHLILLGGSPRYLNDEGYEGGFEMSDLEQIFHDIEYNFSSWVSIFAPNAIGVNDPTAIQEFKSSLGKMKPDVALDVAKTVFLSDLRGVLGHEHIHCTIIQAKKDFVVPTSVSYYMGKRLGKDTRTVILETQGHLPMLTAHSLLLDVLKKVLCIHG
ncbi:hypothetical protein AAC387_Pa03g3790 [Persea americana]